MPIIPALEMLVQEDCHEFEESLSKKVTFKGVARPA